MDRSPQLRHPGVKLGDGILLGEFDVGDELDLRVVAVSEAIRFRRVDVGHVADGAGVEQCADHGGAERAGTAGDDDMTVAIVHRLLPLAARVTASSPMARAMQGRISIPAP
jgi:hypothetical protein